MSDSDHGFKRTNPRDRPRGQRPGKKLETAKALAFVAGLLAALSFAGGVILLVTGEPEVYWITSMACGFWYAIAAAVLHLLIEIRQAQTNTDRPL